MIFIHLNMFDLSNKNILIFGGTGELMSSIATSLYENNASNNNRKKFKTKY